MTDAERTSLVLAAYPLIGGDIAAFCRRLPEDLRADLQQDIACQLMHMEGALLERLRDEGKLRHYWRGIIYKSLYGNRSRFRATYWRDGRRAQLDGEGRRGIPDGGDG